MKRFLLPILSLLALPCSAAELVVGKPKTEHVSEPFSIAFDSKGAMYGVEFTKSNRIFNTVGDTCHVSRLSPTSRGATTSTFNTRRTHPSCASVKK